LNVSLELTEEEANKLFVYGVNQLIDELTDGKNNVVCIECGEPTHKKSVTREISQDDWDAIIMYGICKKIGVEVQAS